MLSTPSRLQHAHNLEPTKTPPNPPINPSHAPYTHHPTTTMPSRRDPKPLNPTLCRRCQTTPPTLTIRTEPLCAPCFTKYVSTKVIKRMESFRVRHSEPGQEPKLLLPLSFGPGSVVLLYLLSRHLEGQREKTGRVGFGLRVVFVGEGEGERLGRVREVFPGCEVEVVPLEEVAAVEDLSNFLPDRESEKDEQSDGARKTTTSLQDLLASLPSPSSRTDALAILHRKLLLYHARTHNCAAILWSSSTTTLATEILSSTAKGRGFSLPWIVADGESPQGVPFYFPLRDLLGKEIESFASIVQDPKLDDLIVKDEAKQTVSMRDATIDGLMRGYFEGVEKEYPSIVANVVKTAGKLEKVSLSEVEMQCELCEMPLQEDTAPERSRLCYGCVRTLGSTAAAG